MLIECRVRAKCFIHMGSFHLYKSPMMMWVHLSFFFFMEEEADAQRG